VPLKLVVVVIVAVVVVAVEYSCKYRVIRNDCRGFNNLSYTIHLR